MAVYATNAKRVTDEMFIEVAWAARTPGGLPSGGPIVLRLRGVIEPNLLVTGPNDLVARIVDAPPGTTLSLEGIVDPDARVYFLNSVARDGVDHR